MNNDKLYVAIGYFYKIATDLSFADYKDIDRRIDDVDVQEPMIEEELFIN
jgi:hypothetical protein